MVACVPFAPQLSLPTSPSFNVERTVGTTFEHSPRRFSLADREETLRRALQVAPWSAWHYRVVSALASFLFAAAWHLVLEHGDVLPAFFLAFFALFSISGGFGSASEAGWISGAAVLLSPRPARPRPWRFGRVEITLAGAAATGAFFAAAAAGTLAAWAGFALFVFCDLGAALCFSLGETKAFDRFVPPRRER